MRTRVEEYTYTILCGFTSSRVDIEDVVYSLWHPFFRRPLLGNTAARWTRRSRRNQDGLVSNPTDDFFLFRANRASGKPKPPGSKYPTASAPSTNQNNRRVHGTLTLKYEVTCGWLTTKRYTYNVHTYGTYYKGKGGKHGIWWKIN